MSCHSVAVVLTLVQTKQIRINIHKRNNTKNTVNTIQNTGNSSTHITKKHTHYKTHIYTHPHITKPTYTHTHTDTVQNPHIHTPTRTHTHTLRNPQIHTHTHITKPTHTLTHTLQNKLKQP